MDLGYSTDSYELLQMEMVATNLQSITVKVINTAGLVADENVSQTSFLSIYGIENAITCRYFNY